MDEHGFLRAFFVLTRHTKTDTSLSAEEMFQHVVHALIPGSGAVLNEHMVFDAGGFLNDSKVRNAAVVAHCYGHPWCNVLDGAGT